MCVCICAWKRTICVKVALSVCEGVHARSNMCVCVYACACECMVAGCVGIATLIYSNVMGLYSSRIVHEIVPEFQTDP